MRFVDHGGGGVGPPAPALGVVGSRLRMPFLEPITNETRSPSLFRTGASCARFCRVSKRHTLDARRIINALARLLPRDPALPSHRRCPIRPLRQLSIRRRMIL